MWIDLQCSVAGSVAILCCSTLLVSGGGKTEVDSSAVAGPAVDLGELVHSAGEADLQALDFAEPAFVLGLGDAGEQVVADLDDACALSGIGPVHAAPSVLCLRVLQAALVYVNTLMVQDVLADDDWATTLTHADRRGLDPLFWTHVAPYGGVRLDMSRRLALGARVSAIT